MKEFIFFFVVFFQPIFKLNINFKDKYPFGLLTQDYGILDEEDLLIDSRSAKPTTYDIEEFQPAYRRWQCFPTKDVSFNFETWRDNDPMGAAVDIIDLCAFSFEVKNVKPIHTYGGRRAYKLGYCEELKNNWNSLTKDEAYVCLNGHPEIYENNEKHWTWEQFKTRKGCKSYFGPRCKD